MGSPAFAQGVATGSEFCGQPKYKFLCGLLLLYTRSVPAAGGSKQVRFLYYSARACAKGLSNQFCPSVSLSVCQSSEKFLNQHIYWVKQLLYTAVT